MLRLIASPSRRSIVRKAVLILYGLALGLVIAWSIQFFWPGQENSLYMVWTFAGAAGVLVLALILHRTSHEFDRDREEKEHEPWGMFGWG